MRQLLTPLLCVLLVVAPATVASANVVVVKGDRIVVTEKVPFQIGDAALPSSSGPLLDEIARAMRDNADIDKVVIEGHTDSEGTPEQNRALSLRRAEAVRQGLIARGIDGGRLVAKGFGDAIPIATNDTTAGREKNRRVEFTITVRAGQKTAHAQPLANIAARYNVVDAKAPEEPAWQQGAVGLPLFRAWRVNTKERSSADVAFRDTARVHLREQTLIVIFGDNDYERKERQELRRATLETGALVSRIDELLDSAPLAVDSPESTVELGRGRAVVESKRGVSRVSNHKGDVAKVRGKTGKKKPAEEPVVELKEGEGTRVVAGKAPEPPRPLPQPPTVTGADGTPTSTTEARSTTAVWEGTASVLRLAFGAPAPAADVVVELRDAQGGIAFTTRVPASTKRVEAKGLSPDNYSVRLAVVDDVGLESAPVVVDAVVPPPPPPPAPAPPVTPAPKPKPTPIVVAAPPAEPEGLCSSLMCPILITAGLVSAVVVGVVIVVAVNEAAP